VPCFPCSIHIIKIYWPRKIIFQQLPASTQLWVNFAFHTISFPCEEFFSLSCFYTQSNDTGRNIIQKCMSSCISPKIAFKKEKGLKVLQKYRCNNNEIQTCNKTHQSLRTVWLFVSPMFLNRFVNPLEKKFPNWNFFMFLNFHPFSQLIMN